MSSDLSQYISRLEELDPDGISKAKALIEKLAEIQAREQAQSSFMSYIKKVWPDFVEGNHHRIIANAFDKVIDGKLKRLAISLPPRHTKSEFGSIHLPAYFLGKFPHLKVIEASNTADLATGFGRKVRDNINSDVYKEIFPNVTLKADSRAAGRWETGQGGVYHAIGVEGAVAGKGADLFIIDDPHSEQQAQQNDTRIYENTYEWYTSGPRQRLQPGAAIVIIMTRWHKLDLLGRIFKQARKDGTIDEWEIIELPAILPSGTPLWPQYWPLKELEAIKAELPDHKWAAQYQQKPTSEEGAIIKRGWWKRWERDKSPECDFVIQSWDTAFSEKEKSDYSACTTWGIFYRSSEKGRNVANVILLDAFKKRMDFPELKELAYSTWTKWKPDSLVVEGKASGKPLIQELRARGVPVQEFSPFRGNDKRVRLNAVSDIFSSGIVWAPDTSWADEVIEEVAEFPHGEHDDYVDSTTQALKRMRDGGFMPLESDESFDEDENFEPVMANYY